MSYKAKNAIDLMIPIDLLPQVSPETTIKEVIPFIKNYRMKINGKDQPSRAILVIQDNSLVGIVQRRDILSGLDINKYFGLNNIPSGLENDFDTNLLEVSFPFIKEKLKEELNRKVNEIMAPVDQSVDVNDHIFKVIYTLKDYRVVPVCEKSKVVGVIRTVEIMEEIADIFELKNEK